MFGLEGARARPQGLCLSWFSALPASPALAGTAIRSINGVAAASMPREKTTAAAVKRMIEEMLPMLIHGL
jgi:hypothetical protein